MSLYEHKEVNLNQNGEMLGLMKFMEAEIGLIYLYISLL